MTVPHLTHRYAAAVLLCWLLLLAPSPAWAGVSDPARYRLTDLGALVDARAGHANASFPAAINNAGQVVVNATPAGNGPLPFSVFLYGGGRVTAPAVPADPSVRATGINDAGQVVGSFGLYAGGRVTDLPAPGGGAGSSPSGINNAGRVVGGYEQSTPDGGSRPRPFLYAGGQATDLGTPAGTDAGAAAAINGAGQVVGSAADAAGRARAFLHAGGRTRDLNDLVAADGGGGWVLERATDVNDAGQIVGSGSRAGGAGHMFLYADGRVTDLGALDGTVEGSPAAVNEAGQVVGSVRVADGDTRPFLYDGGAMYDLNDLLAEPGGGLTLFAAIGINDAGLIIANASDEQFRTHAVLLTPVDGGTVGPPPAVPLPPAAWAGLATLAGLAVAQARLRRGSCR